MVESIYHFLHWLVLGFIFSIYCIILCGAKENKEKQKKDKPPTPTVAKTEKTSKSAKKGSNNNSKKGARRTAPSKSDRTQNSVEQPPQQLMLLNDVKKTQQTKTTGEELQTTPEGSKEKEKDTNKAVVNEYVKKAAAEGNILDPKHVKNMGNIDDIEKENHVDKVKDLENIKSEPDPQSVSMVPLDPKKRVSINETACKLYETNDIATMEDGEDNQEGEV